MKEQVGQKQTGFTIVELLIVIVVIGILAAIVIVAFNGVQARAHDAAVKNDLASLYKQILQFETTTGAYPRGTMPAPDHIFWSQDMNLLGPKVTKSAYSSGYQLSGTGYNLVYCPDNASSPTRFALVAQSKSGNVFRAADGNVREAEGDSFTGGSDAICGRAGVSGAGTSRVWLYSGSNWQAFVKS